MHILIDDDESVQQIMASNKRSKILFMEKAIKGLKTCKFNALYFFFRDQIEDDDEDDPDNF